MPLASTEKCATPLDTGEMKLKWRQYSYDMTTRTDLELACEAAMPPTRVPVYNIVTTQPRIQLAIAHEDVSRRRIRNIMPYMTVSRPHTR